MTFLPLQDDLALLQKVAEGDERAFELIYNRYAKKVYTFAFKTLNSVSLAEEVMQEVMLRLWRMGAALTSINNLEAYLRTASRNISLNLLRRQEIENRANNRIGQDWQEVNNETVELVLLNETRKILDNAVSLLPHQQREVYKLCHQQGLKYTEAAEKLNLTPSTVATHMKLALKFLRAYLKKHGDLAVLLFILKLF